MTWAGGWSWLRVAITIRPRNYLGRDRFASSGRGMSSAGSRIVSHETIDQTETG